MDEALYIQTFINSGIAQCTEAVVGSEGLLMSLFLVGLSGSAGHCVGMCGPFVISQVQTRLEQVSASNMTEFSRLSGAALLPYHAGRGTTYMGLGAVTALMAGQAASFPALQWLGAGLLVVAGLFLVRYALVGLGAGLFSQTLKKTESGLVRAWTRLVRPLFKQPTGSRGFGLGVALGFLPCGLLYGAVAASASSGEWLTAVFSMGAFWLGTVPALFGIGLAGSALMGRWPYIARTVAPIVLMMNAGFLFYMAFGLLRS